jgi:hypothetical protein
MAHSILAQCRENLHEQGFIKLDAYQGVEVYIKGSKDEINIGVTLIKQPNQAYPTIKFGVLHHSVMSNSVDIPAIKKIAAIMLTTSSVIIEGNTFSVLKNNSDNEKFTKIFKDELHKFSSMEQDILNDFKKSMVLLIRPKLFSEDNIGAIYLYGLIYKKLCGNSIKHIIEECRLNLDKEPEELRQFNFKIAHCSFLQK